MSQIRISDLEHAADLSQLALTAEEKQMFSEQLTEILHAVDRLLELDTDDVQPTVYGGDLTNVLRADENHQSLERERALQNAPQPQDGFFRVPRIIE